MLRRKREFREMLHTDVLMPGAQDAGQESQFRGSTGMCESDAQERRRMRGAIARLLEV